MEKCIQDDCYYARKFERPILKRKEELEDPIMRIRVLNFHVQFWNGCLTEDDVNHFAIFACLPHHFGDTDMLNYLYSNYGVMYAFDCQISKPKLRLKSLPTPLDSVKRVERIAKITVKASCTNIPSSEHENTIVKTLTERVQELESQLEQQKELTRIVNLQLSTAKIENQKLKELNQLVCVICNTKFDSEDKLDNHLSDFHPNIFENFIGKPSESKVLTCQPSTSTACTSKPSTSKALTCQPSTSTAFTSQASTTKSSTSEPLAKKKKVARNKDTNQYPCLICGKKFKSNKILAVHVKSIHNL